jgi:hypothetical protein
MGTSPKVQTMFENVEGRAGPSTAMLDWWHDNLLNEKEVNIYVIEKLVPSYECRCPTCRIEFPKPYS